MAIIDDLATAMAEQFKTMFLDISQQFGVLGQDEAGDDVYMFTEEQWEEALGGAGSSSMQELVQAMYLNQAMDIRKAFGQVKTGTAFFNAANTVAVTGLGFTDTDYVVMVTPCDNFTAYVERSSLSEDGFTISTTAPISKYIMWVVIKTPTSPETS